MRILILADCCNPCWPSLPLFTYHHIVKIADLVEVVVATQVRNRRNIEQAGIGKAKVVYINNECLAGPLYKLGLVLRRNDCLDWNIQYALSYPSYLLFEWLVLKHFRHELVQHKYDIVHRMNPIQSTLPSYIAKKMSGAVFNRSAERGASLARTDSIHLQTGNEFGESRCLSIDERLYFLTLLPFNL